VCMGRIKTQQTKRVSFELIKKHGNSFKKDFNENKEIVESFVELRSKKLRNTITGYVTRLVRSGQVEE